MLNGYLHFICELPVFPCTLFFFFLHGMFFFLRVALDSYYVCFASEAEPCGERLLLRGALGSNSGSISEQIL